VSQVSRAKLISERGRASFAAQGVFGGVDDVVDAESVGWRGCVPVGGGEGGGKREDLRVDRGDEQRAMVAGGHEQVQAPLPPCPQWMTLALNPWPVARPVAAR
jgi:hypothetical protein